MENFRGHLIREKKRMLEATAGYITVWLDMMAASDTKKNTKQRKHARMGTVNLIFKIFMVSKIPWVPKLINGGVQIRSGGTFYVAP